MASKQMKYLGRGLCRNLGTRNQGLLSTNKSVIELKLQRSRERLGMKAIWLDKKTKMQEMQVRDSEKYGVCA